LEEFGNDKQKHDGKRPECKQCKSARDRVYKQTHKEEISKKDKNYYIKNNEAIKKRAAEWYDANKQQHLDKAREWRNSNREKWLEGKKRWYEQNKRKMQEYINQYMKEKYATDIHYKVKSICSARIRSLVKKTCSTYEILGCTREFFMAWIEFQFDEHMNWNNAGSYWHFDHVQPCASFDLCEEKELLKCFNWTNIRPLEAKENLSKHDKIIDHIINEQESKVSIFLKQYNDVPSQ
jgi:hypothetical protein